MEFNNHFPGSSKAQENTPLQHDIPSKTVKTEQDQYPMAIINAVWEKAQKEYGFVFFRHDHLGKTIARHDYGKKTQYGWMIAHIVPLSNGGTNDIGNLQPVHWEYALLKGEQ